jgi:hypothetical protein
VCLLCRSGYTVHCTFKIRLVAHTFEFLDTLNNIKNFEHNRKELMRSLSLYASETYVYAQRVPSSPPEKINDGKSQTW